MRLYVCVVHGVAVLVKCINASHTIDKVTCLFNMLQMCTGPDWADTFYLLINQNHKYADNSVSVWTKRKRIAHFIHRFHLTNNFVLILVFGTRAATLSVAIGKTVEHRQMMWSELFDFFSLFTLWSKTNFMYHTHQAKYKFVEKSNERRRSDEKWTFLEQFRVEAGSFYRTLAVDCLFSLIAYELAEHRIPSVGVRRNREKTERETIYTHDTVYAIRAQQQITIH